LRPSNEAASKSEGVMKEISWNFAWSCCGRSAIVQIASTQAAILQLDNPVSCHHKHIILLPLLFNQENNLQLKVTKTAHDNVLNYDSYQFRKFDDCYLQQTQ
jgi:hypothetical protein